MENLNKENFFNRMQELYPEAMAHFCEWIDKYKEEVMWSSKIAGGNKFHDLPHEMQIGIVMRYVSSLNNPDNFPKIKDTENILEKAFTYFRPKK